MALAAGGVVPDSGDMDNPAGDGPPAQPQGGAAQGQGNTAQGGPPQLAGYVSGAGALPPEQAQALQQRVDPQEQMDPTERNIRAVAAAGDPPAQFGMIQHLRGKFEAAKAFAQAALTGGSGGKPADINASTHAATQAYQNVPDGNSVTFTPHSKGVAVGVKQLASRGGKGGNKSFDDGGVVPQDPLSAAGVDDSDSDTSDTSQDTGNPMANDSQPAAQGDSSMASGMKNFIMSIPQYFNFLKGVPGSFDNTMDTDIASTLGSMQSQGGPGDETNATRAPVAPSAPSGMTPAQRFPGGQYPAVVQAGTAGAKGNVGRQTVPPPVAQAASPPPNLSGPAASNRFKPAAAAQPAAPAATASGGTNGAPPAQGSDLNSFINDFNQKNGTNFSVGRNNPQAVAGAQLTNPNSVSANPQSTVTPQPVSGSQQSGGVTDPNTGQVIWKPGDRPLPSINSPDSGIPQDLQRRSFALFPKASQAAARSNYIAKVMGDTAEQKNKLDIAENTRINYGNAIAGGRNIDSATKANADITKANIGADSRQNVERAKAQATITAARLRATNPVLSGQFNAFRAAITAGQPIAKAAQDTGVAQYLGQMGINVQPPAQQGGQAGGDQPPPQALQHLTEGSPTTFKNGQTWTLQNGQPVRVQ